MLASVRTPPGIPFVPVKNWATSATSLAGSLNAMAPACAIGPATVLRTVRSEFGRLHIRLRAEIEGLLLLRLPVYVFIILGVCSVARIRSIGGCSYPHSE